ncbi:MAG TPA: alpha/beta fold hydrolase [Longimicrobium sp.]|nr:alpha/beta fold hydrolase [Longimicrobium sp.]
MFLRPLLLAAALAIPSVAAAQSVTWGSCEPVATRARCGTITVPEARDTPGGRSIDVAFAVLPATDSAGRSPDPVLVLFGGPGDAGIERLRGVEAAFAVINRTRDLVVVDQRGTGRSAPLRCVFGSDDDLQSYLEAFLPVAAMRECSARLGAGADLSRYRTRDFVADLEALRSALGIARWNLYARSYGTRVALHYLQRHPEPIRSATLVGVVPPELTVPMTLGADADAALERVAADCRADSACAAAFPRFREEVDSIARRLERAPAAVSLPHPMTDQPITLTLSRGTFGEMVRAILYTPEGASQLPLLVHEAFGGDYRFLLMTGLGRRRGLARSGAAGLYLAVTCAEDVRRVDPQAALASNRGSTMGTARVAQHLEACQAWPARPTGDEFPTAAAIRVPVLMIVGDADPATAPRWAEVAMRAMENGRLVIVPQGGHDFGRMSGGDCLDRVQAAFLAAPDPAALDAECVKAMRRPPFVLRREGS